MNTIDINYELEEFSKIIQEDIIEKWAQDILKELKIDNKVLSIYLTTDEIIKDLNKRYRKKDYVTDVLSFPQIIEDEENEFFDNEFLGDIAISLPQAERQALERENDLIKEIKFLILHGILHLNNYDHENDNGEMDKIEKEIYYKLTGEEIE